MASNLPINFAVPNEGIIASYSYNDLATGLGYVNFYPVVLGGVDKLVTSQEYSQEGQYQYGSAVNSTTLYEKTFVANIGSTRTMYGEAIISCPWGATRNDNTATITGTIYKNAVELVTGNKEHTWTVDNNGQGAYMSLILSIPLTTLKKGDQLKIKIKINTNYAYDGITTWISPYPKLTVWTGSALTWTMNRTVVICSIPFLVQN